jgi:hypothetical protein
MGPDHTIAQDYKQAVGRQEARGYLIVVNGVIDRQVQLPEESVQGDPNIVGVVITIADESQRSRSSVIGREGDALSLRFKKNSR